MGSSERTVHGQPSRLGPLHPPRPLLPKKTPPPTGMVTYRVSSSSKEQYWNLGEIKLTNKGKPVKIDPKSCSSSSVIGNNGCQRLFDGNTGTYWSPDYANKQKHSRDYWIEFKAGPADSISIYQSGHEHSYAALTKNGGKAQKLPLIRKSVHGQPSRLRKPKSENER